MGLNEVNLEQIAKWGGGGGGELGQNSANCESVGLNSVKLAQIVIVWG